MYALLRAIRSKIRHHIVNAHTISQSYPEKHLMNTPSQHPHINHPDAPSGIAPPAAHAHLPSFGLLVIGDEILSGRRSDKHVSHVINMLAQRGLALSYVHMQADNRGRLTALLQQLFTSGDVVLCCGGIGSTPDDHTRQAAAAAWGVDVAPHLDAIALIETRARQMAHDKGTAFDIHTQENQQRLQMGYFPQGAQLLPNPYNRIAGFSCGHVHFCPGFPVMAHPMMAWVLDTYYPQWQQQRNWVEYSLIVQGAGEAHLTSLMQQIERNHPTVKIFSLPSISHPQYGAHIELGTKGTQPQALAAFNDLQTALGTMDIPCTIIQK